MPYAAATATIASLDALTGLAGRGRFLSCLRELAAAGRPVAVILLDGVFFTCGVSHAVAGLTRRPLVGRAGRQGRAAPWAA